MSEKKTSRSVASLRGILWEHIERAQKKSTEDPFDPERAAATIKGAEVILNTYAMEIKIAQITKKLTPGLEEEYGQAQITGGGGKEETEGEDKEVGAGES